VEGGAGDEEGGLKVLALRHSEFAQERAPE
jgi:hypothetical protein